MKTYQDLLAVGTDETKRMEFVLAVIADHTNSELYQEAQLADEYDRRKNRTITQYQKLLYTISGQAVPDNYSANYKLPSNFFHRFVVQENQTLLANGVDFGKEETKKRLGRDFDNKISKIGRYALCAGVCYGFFDLDHIEIFPVYDQLLPSFAPLPDETTGAIMAGVRFWRLDKNKPLNAELYEIDGFTRYIWKKADKGEVLQEKRAYIIRTRGDATDEAAGTLQHIGENYPMFPIIPFYGNFHHQSELIGLQQGIDCYDLIKSGFANTVDEASLIYWTISNAGGMDDVDLVQFVEHMKTVKAAVVSEQGANAESHTLEAPYQSRETLLSRIENDLYRDFMAVKTDDIAAGNVTATQITAAYDAHNSKVDEYETCVIEFIQGILAVAGLEDDPTFTRSQVVNSSELMTNILASAQYLSEEYITEKLLNILGDGDRIEEVLAQKDAEDFERGKSLQEELDEEDEDEGSAEGEDGGEI